MTSKTAKKPKKDLPKAVPKPLPKGTYIRRKHPKRIKRDRKDEELRP